MPGNVVILFMFGVLASFGIVWLANDLRLRYQARYLEYNFYFILSSICYGFANWIAPFAVLYLLDVNQGVDPIWFIAIFVLMAVPVLLAVAPATYVGSLVSRRVPVLLLRRFLAVLIAAAAVRIWITIFT